MNREPRALSRFEQRSWQRIGNVLAPGNEQLPQYGYTNATDWIPEILAASSQEDEESVRWVVLIIGVLPLLLIRWLMQGLSFLAYNTGALGALPRLLLIGVKGVIYSSYYAGLDGVDGESQVYAGMQYDAHCEPVPANPASSHQNNVKNITPTHAKASNQ